MTRHAPFLALLFAASLLQGQIVPHNPIVAAGGGSDSDTVNADGDDAYYSTSQGFEINCDLWSGGCYASEASTADIVGYRFELDIPDGTTISTAVLTLDMCSDVSGQFTGTINGEDEVDPPVFSSSAGNRPDNITPLTTANVSWVFPSNPTGTQDSPDISSIIQEIVDLAGWTSPPHNIRLNLVGGSGSDYIQVADYSGGTSCGDPAVLAVTW